MRNIIIKTLTIGVLLTGTAFAWGGATMQESMQSIEDEKEFNQIAAQHILVRNAADAVKIKKAIDDGGDFEYYAQKYSLCPSGKNGGYLGYFSRGQMVPEFEKKAFSMKVGEVSSPIRTNFGWHIIRVLDKK